MPTVKSVFELNRKLLFGNLSAQHGCIMDFISGIDRYSKMKPYGQGRFRNGLAQETVGVGMVIGKRPGLVRYVVQTGALTSGKVSIAGVHETNLMVFGPEDFLMVAAPVGEHPLSGHGSMGFVNRLVRRRRMLGGVGAGG
jgi:hypothetical protein